LSGGLPALDIFDSCKPQEVYVSETLSSYIADRWVDGTDAYELWSPSSGESLAEVIRCSFQDVDDAVSAAREAFEHTRWMPLRERVDLCHRCADLIEERTETLAVALSEEHGKPLTESLAEIKVGAYGFRLAAEEARRLGGYNPLTDDPNKRVIVMRQPRGVWAIVTPWNFPFNIPIEYLGPALATGTPFVWKPAPTTPRIAVRLTELMLEAGAPKGTVNLILTDSVEPAQHLVSHPGVDAVGLTGGSKTGAAVAKAAWDKHLLLELGGNGPIIVLDDADLEKALPAIVDASFANAGQVCSSAGTVMANERLADELVAGLRQHADDLVLGSPLSEGVTLGPVHTEAVASTVDQHVADLVERGGEVVTGGKRASGFPTQLFYQPTVADSVTSESLAVREETFGPLAPVIRLSDDKAILRAANAGRHGLVAAVFTSSLARAFWFAERLEAGSVVVNDTSNYWELHLPFGGRPGRESGRGRLGGRHTLEEFTQLKTVSLDVR
jgi:acyl-CoA reductase-like NAD-dependent aldehyde dehydrogenase